MSVVTISAIKADIGGYVGHSDVHPDLLAEAQRRVGAAVAKGLLIDASANACGDDVNLVMTHRRGVDAERCTTSRGTRSWS
jgi:fructose 1,6-bisphosphate aldolase/phosphatase